MPAVPVLISVPVSLERLQNDFDFSATAVHTMERGIFADEILVSIEHVLAFDEYGEFLVDLDVELVAILADHVHVDVVIDVIHVVPHRDVKLQLPLSPQPFEQLHDELTPPERYWDKNPAVPPDSP